MKDHNLAVFGVLDIELDEPIFWVLVGREQS